MSAENPQPNPQFPNPLGFGDDIRKNWRAINELLAITRRQQDQLNTLRAYVDALRGRRSIIQSSVGSTYAGTYSAEQTYTEGTIVRVLSGDTAGFWIVAPGQTAEADDAPEWPEPGTPIWHRMTLGFQQVNICSDASTQIYIMASDPF